LRSHGGGFVVAKTEERPLAGKTRFILYVNLKPHERDALVVAGLVDGAFALRAANFEDEHGIAAQVREGNNDGAVDMIAGLSEFLRHLLRDGRQEVPLGEELEFVQKYLDIQKVRFADRLQVKIDVVKELDGARVPSLILQPIVENAVKHGIAKRAQGGAIEISAMRGDGKLTLSVYNDGPSLPVDWEGKRAAIGLCNVRERLQSLYGDDSELKMTNKDARGVKVSISVPFREE
jgi:two-component system, LytTR family, sensor kinase